MCDCICVFVIEFVPLFMTVFSLDSAAGKETLLLILHLICTSFCDRLLSPHQVLSSEVLSSCVSLVAFDCQWFWSCLEDRWQEAYLM